MEFQAESMPGSGLDGTSYNFLQVPLELFHSMWYNIGVKNLIHEKEGCNELPLDKVKGKCYNGGIGKNISEQNFKPDFPPGRRGTGTRKTGLAGLAGRKPLDRLSKKTDQLLCESKGKV